MPPIKKPAPGYDFGAFPAPPPGAEDWQPDPDSIARPGDLKDVRFNRDPYHDARLRTARRELGYHVREDSLSVNSSQASPARATPVNYLAMGQWPRQELRTYRPEVTPPNSASQVPNRAANSMQPVIAKPTSATTQSSTSTTLGTDVTKQASIKHQTDVPSMDLPAWAGPLEQALAEIRPPTPSVCDSPPKSLPPHLRKAAAQKISNGSLEKSPPRKPRVLQERVSSLDADFEAACEAARRVSDPTATQIEAYLEFQSAEIKVDTTEARPFHPPQAKETEATIAVHGARIANPMHAIDKFIETLRQTASVTNKDQRSTDYGHHFKVSMLLNIFRDLLEPEFAKLSSEELENRILEISSLREQLWHNVHSKNVLVSNGHHVNGLSNGHQMNGISQSYPLNNSKL